MPRLAREGVKLSDWWSICRERSKGSLSTHYVLLRLGLVVQLQNKGWFKPNVGESYIDWMSQEWRHREEVYRFDQRLNLLFLSGLSQPSKRARHLVEALIGQVPCLGTGLFEELLETPQGSEFEWFFDEGWVLASQETGEFNREADRPSINPIINSHFHDSNCGTGQRLAQLLNESLCQRENLTGAKLDSWPSEILADSLSGNEPDPHKALEARFRLALVGLEWQSESSPVPLPDLRRTVVSHQSFESQPIEESMVEGTRVEFKAGYDWNPQTQSKNPELRLGVMKSIAAFLNTEGGTLFIGVNDQGKPIGLEQEFEALRTSKPCDVFESKIREGIKNHLEPVPLGSVSVSFPIKEGKTICQVQVQPVNGVTYLNRKDEFGRAVEEVFVRDGNRTVSLTGRTRDRFVIKRCSS